MLRAYLADGSTFNRFGPALQTFTKPGGVRCIYYDVIGYQTGWTFCFYGPRMVGAAGN